MQAFTYDVAAGTNIGTVKPANEDSHIVLTRNAGGQTHVLIAVADGISGLQNGKAASQLTIKAIENWWQANHTALFSDSSAVMAQLAVCVKAANDEIYRENQKAGTSSGTTLSVLLALAGTYSIFHVGDSRVYALGNGLLASVKQLTTDHTKLMPKEINGTVVMKAYLTDCIGYQPDFNYQQLSGSYAPGTAFLVCTDGIYNTLNQAAIKKALRSRATPENACKSLIEKAIANGEKDNLTAAILRILK